MSMISSLRQPSPTGWFLVGLALLLSVAPFRGRADRAAAAIAGIERITNGISTAIYAAHAPGDANRLFVATKQGQIRIVDLTTNTVLATPFLTISDTNSASNESGLLGFAFHPDFGNNGKFYVNVNVNNGVTPFDTRIREYTVSTGNPNVANATPKEILRIQQPQNNHNAGWIGFSPNDGYLYIPTGDGGSGYDSGTGHTAGTGNAQDLTDNLLGKLLRIDVNGDDFPADANKNYAIPPTNPFVGVTGDDEIYDYGLRNPFRAGFDRATGDLWIGDVGQDNFEEVDLHPAGTPGGINFGWKQMEGFGATKDASGAVVGSVIPTARLPQYAYQQPDAPGSSGATNFTGRSVIGGFIYRGPDPTLRGKYYFGDANDNQYWTFDPANPAATVANIESLLTPNVGSLTAPYAFGEDLVGNLYIVIPANGVYRVKTNAFVPGDFQADADVDGEDLTRWVAGFGTASGATNSNGDANGNGAVDGADFLAWQRNFGNSALNVGGATAANSGVPEPAAVLLALVGFALLGRSRRHATGSNSPASYR